MTNYFNALKNAKRALQGVQTLVAGAFMTSVLQNASQAQVHIEVVLRDERQQEVREMVPSQEYTADIVATNLSGEEVVGVNVALQMPSSFHFTKVFLPGNNPELYRAGLFKGYATIDQIDNVMNGQFARIVFPKSTGLVGPDSGASGKIMSYRCFAQTNLSLQTLSWKYAFAYKPDRSKHLVEAHPNTFAVTPLTRTNAIIIPGMLEHYVVGVPQVRFVAEESRDLKNWTATYTNSPAGESFDYPVLLSPGENHSFMRVRAFDILR